MESGEDHWGRVFFKLHQVLKKVSSQIPKTANVNACVSSEK